MRLARPLLPPARLLASLAWIATLLSLALPAEGQSPQITLALDVSTTGNSPRLAGPIESCVSATAGAPFAVDVVIPSPGIPADRGISGYELRLFYDPLILSVNAENSNMLLTQAAGSTVIPFSDSTANNDGEYVALAVDFGNGIEPAGASETGPGVLVRLTLSTLRNGGSPLVLRDPKIYADDGQELPVASVLSGSVTVGQPCPVPSPSPARAVTPSPTPVPEPAPSPAATAPATVVGLGSAGGPPSHGKAALSLLLAGASAFFIGAVLVLAGFSGHRR